MKLSSTLTCASAVLVSASPIAKDSKAQFGGVQQLATFDNLPAVPAAPEVNPIGTYMGLKYNSFNVLQQGVAGIITTGIRPRSGLQTASNGVTDNVLRGGPALSPAAPNKAFDLESLYLACVVNSVESVAGVPSQCTIAFTAYKKGSNEAFQTVNKQFNPTNPLLSDMIRADFPKSWTDLGRVELAIVQGTATEALTAVLVDDIKYVLKK